MPSFTVFKGSKDGSIQQSETKKNELTGDQVLLKVTASGLCGTGESLTLHRNDHHQTTY